jgi:hypothetical protein
MRCRSTLTAKGLAQSALPRCRPVPDGMLPLGGRYMPKRTGRREPRRDGGSCARFLQRRPGPPENPPRAQGATPKASRTSPRYARAPRPPPVPGGAGGPCSSRPRVHPVGRGGYAPLSALVVAGAPTLMLRALAGRPAVDSAALGRMSCSATTIARWRLLGRRNGDPVTAIRIARAIVKEAGRLKVAEPAHGRAAHREPGSRPERSAVRRDRPDAGDALPRGDVRLRVGRPARRGASATARVFGQYLKRTGNVTGAAALQRLRREREHANCHRYPSR